MNYQKMYAILCCAMSDAIDELKDIPETEMITGRMETALHQAEALYVEQKE